MDEDSSALRIDPETVAGARVRLRLDWRTFAGLVLAVLTALALIALIRNTSTMLTRVGLGVLIALALDPIVGSIERRWHVRRGFAVTIVAVAVGVLAALLVGVLGPQAVDQARSFSQQLPETIDQLESLPVLGPYIRQNQVGERVQEWVRQLPEQFTDERITELAGALVSGVVSVAIVAILTIAVLVDGPNLLGRLRRLLPPPRRAQADVVGGVMYRTIGRYFGGSITVAVLMGLYVLALGLLLGIPLVPLAAVWAMLTDLIPQVGGFLGGSFLVLLASTQGATTALVAGGAFVLYMNLENHVIQPAIVGRSVDLTPPTTMVAAFIGASVLGVPGALVATPLVGAAKAIYMEARGQTNRESESDEGLLDRLKRAVRRRKD